MPAARSVEICQCSFSPMAGGAIELQSPSQTVTESPQHVSDGCPEEKAPALTHPVLPRETPLRTLHRECKDLALGLSVVFLQLCCSQSLAGCPN